MLAEVRCRRPSWMIPLLCPAVKQPLFPQQRLLGMRSKVCVVRALLARMLGLLSMMRQPLLPRFCMLRLLLRLRCRGRRREEVEGKAGQNSKAQRLGILGVVIECGILCLSRPWTAVAQRSHRRELLAAYLTT